MIQATGSGSGLSQPTSKTRLPALRIRTSLTGPVPNAEVSVAIHPYDDYIRAASLVDAPTPEGDLFAGLRAEVNV